MKKRPLSILSLSAVAGLALLIQPSLSATAFAAPGSGSQAPASSEPVQGRIVNVTIDRDCIDPTGVRLCSVNIAGIALSDQGEVIDRQIVATRQGNIIAPGDQAPNRSYALWTYPDGATLLMHSEGKTEMTADGQRVTSGTKTCVEGSGRLAGVDCTIDWSHARQPSGLSTGSYSGTMTPKGEA